MAGGQWPAEDEDLVDCWSLITGCHWSLTTALSTTLSDPQGKHPSELNDVIDLLRIRRKVQRGENLADERADHRKRQRATACMPPLLLQKGIGGGGEHHVTIPAGVTAAFEVI